MTTDPHTEMRKRRWERRFLRETGLPSMAAYNALANAEIERQLSAG